MDKKFKVIDFQELGDSRGHLVVAESNKEVPFLIQRIFYIYGTKDGVVRGQHANRESEFMLINLQGSVKIVIDDGRQKDTVILNKAHQGVYLDKMVWKDMCEFSSDSILLVLSSMSYDASEYIRDYDEFVREVNDGKLD
ncbi:WxcM-like, C-terminal [Acetoanaerobium noterae]|uniref:WxcM-like, C-terminal n=1 Tax=Acetoanaerobium noterae TaxID=745369 RepID=A0A1T5B3A4_9FIRM|nr:FdtA/QdtA family cupin domain-containing protein [Acetoanaerobium noterae]SKB41675.1 WxcM-like, C-terminal [Acetoanaerobium noterae]